MKNKNILFQLENGEIMAANNIVNGKIIAINDAANRMTFSYVAHVIHEDKTDSNKNGLNWQEEYVRNNIDSAIGMPIKYAKDYDGFPDDHGYFGKDEDGNIVSFYAEIAGFTTDARIETIPGTSRRGLICDAYIDKVVHSGLAKWMKLRFLERRTIDTSIEITGKSDKNGDMTPIVHDGDPKGTPAIPMEFDYIGSAILGVEPADDYAVVLVVNNKGEEVEMNIEQLKAELVLVRADLVVKTNSLTAEEGKVTELTDANTVLTDTNTDLVATNATLVSERDELKEYKEEAEEKVIVNTFIDKLNEDFDEKVVTEFKEEIDKYKNNSKDFDTNELMISMYKKTAEFAKADTKEAQATILANSKKEDGFFVLNEVNENNEDEDEVNIDDAFEQ